MTKILLINDYSIKNDDAVGITLRSLFLSEDNDYEILEIFKNSKNEEVSIEVNSFKVSNKVMPLLTFFKFLKKITDKNSKNEKLATVNNSSSVKANIKEIILFYSEYLMKLDKNEIECIKKFKPDYIYTIGGSVFSIKYSLMISNLLDIPIVFHVMDNWKDSLYNSNKKIKVKFLNLVEKIEEQSASLVTISNKMYDEYYKYRNKTFVLMNTVNLENGTIINKSSRRKKRNITFIGGIHLNRWMEIKKIAEFIRSNGLEDHFQILIYSNSPKTEEYVELFKDDLIIDCGKLPHEKLMEAYDVSDILLHVESFDSETKSYTKYSMSTKIPEYLATRKVVLFYGPTDISVYEYINTNKIGFVSSTEEELIQCLKIYLNESKVVEDYIKNGFTLVNERHSISYRNKTLSKIFK